MKKVDMGAYQQILVENTYYEQNTKNEKINMSITDSIPENSIDTNMSITENTPERIMNVDQTENKQIAEIQIPKIDLKAVIAEGTTKEIMDEYVGHFENTSLWDGNIGLAAHNRGYPVNYFANIKDLQIGDEIIYITQEGTRTYLINDINIIEDTDWSYLQTTEDNRITLITCVENEPSYRRCVQGIQKL